MNFTVARFFYYNIKLFYTFLESVFHGFVFLLKIRPIHIIERIWISLYYKKPSKTISFIYKLSQLWFYFCISFSLHLNCIQPCLMRLKDLYWKGYYPTYILHNPFDAKFWRNEDCENKSIHVSLKWVYTCNFIDSINKYD